MKVIQSNSLFSQRIKPIVQKIVFHKPNASKLMIIGCQRSGTTLLTRLFDDLLSCSVYGEFSKLSSHDPGRIRLKPYDSPLRILTRDKAPLIVMKPLVESQNADELLSAFDGAKLLWVFRNPMDVGLSMIKKFGVKSGFYKGLIPIVEHENPVYQNNWRAEKVSAETVNLCRKYYSEDMLPLDAALLFWYSRNIIFFEQNLDQNPACCLFYYDDFLDEPLKHFNRVLAFMEKPQVADCREVKKQPTKSGDYPYTPEIYEICHALHQRLMDTYHSQLTQSR